MFKHTEKRKRKHKKRETIERIKVFFSFQSIFGILERLQKVSEPAALQMTFLCTHEAFALHWML